MTSETAHNLYCPHYETLTLFLTLKASKSYILGFLFSFKAILFPDTYDTSLGNENTLTFLLIATYTSCEYTYEFSILDKTLFAWTVLCSMAMYFLYKFFVWVFKLFIYFLFLVKKKIMQSCLSFSTNLFTLEHQLQELSLTLVEK